MTIALRFARGATGSEANSTAALALMRALTYQLVETKRLDPSEVELIRERAIAQLPLGSDDPSAIEARMLILYEFP